MRRLLPLLVLALVPSLARANLRVWEANADNPDKLKYFEVTGYVQPGYMFRINDDQKTDASGNLDRTTHGLLAYTDSMFWLQRARLGFKAQLTPLFRLRFELEASGSAVLQDAYIESQVRPWLIFRAGQFQLAFLRTFQFSEDTLGFLDRTLYVPQDQERAALKYLSPRDVGFMITGKIGNLDPHAGSPVLEYWVGAFNGAGPNHFDNPDRAYLYSARAQVHVFGPPVGEAAESDLARNTIPRLAIGTGVYMNCDDQLNVNRGETVDAEFRYQGFFASASLVRFHVSPAGGPGSLDNALGYAHCSGGQAQANHIAIGAAVQAQYLLPQKLIPPVLGNNAFELLARWDYVDPFAPADVILGTGQGTPGYVPPTDYKDEYHPPATWRLTLGVNWFPTGQQTLRLGINYENNHQLEPVHLTNGLVASSILNDVLWLQMTASL